MGLIFCPSSLICEVKHLHAEGGGDFRMMGKWRLCLFLDMLLVFGRFPLLIGLFFTSNIKTRISECSSERGSHTLPHRHISWQTFTVMCKRNNAIVFISLLFYLVSFLTFAQHHIPLTNSFLHAATAALRHNFLWNILKLTYFWLCTYTHTLVHISIS